MPSSNLAFAHVAPVASLPSQASFPVDLPARVLLDVATDRRLHPTDVRLFAYLAATAALKGTGLATMSQETMREDLGVCERTVRSSLKRLRSVLDEEGRPVRPRLRGLDRLGPGSTIRYAFPGIPHVLHRQPVAGVTAAGCRQVSSSSASQTLPTSSSLEPRRSPAPRAARGDDDGQVASLTKREPKPKPPDPWTVVDEAMIERLAAAVGLDVEEARRGVTLTVEWRDPARGGRQPAAAYAWSARGMENYLHARLKVHARHVARDKAYAASQSFVPRDDRPNPPGARLEPLEPQPANAAAMRSSDEPLELTGETAEVADELAAHELVLDALAPELTPEEREVGEAAAAEVVATIGDTVKPGLIASIWQQKKAARRERSSIAKVNETAPVEPSSLTIQQTSEAPGAPPDARSAPGPQGRVGPTTGGAGGLLGALQRLPPVGRKLALVGSDPKVPKTVHIYERYRTSTAPPDDPDAAAITAVPAPHDGGAEPPRASTGGAKKAIMDARASLSGALEDPRGEGFEAEPAGQGTTGSGGFSTRNP